MSGSESNENVLYRFYNCDGELLYIGITNNPWRRFSQHRQDKDWWHEVVNICQQSFKTLDALKAAEKRAIERENPRHNKQFVRGGLNTPQPIEHGSNTSLVGKFFHSWREVEDPEYEIVKNGRAVHWQGHVLGQISPQKYLIELFSWWDGCPTGQRISDLSEMVDWTFYSNHIEMLLSLGCGDHIWTNDHKDRGRCGRTIIGIAGLELGFGPSAVCSSCAQHYSSVQPIEHRNGEFNLGKAISIATRQRGSAAPVSKRGSE